MNDMEVKIEFINWKKRKSLGYRYKKHYWFFRSWLSKTPVSTNYGLGLFGLQIIISK